jgi:hypothetical protein
MDDNMPMSFWENLKERISAEGTTQEWVSGKVGVHPVTFRRWVSKQIMPNADQAVIIARSLKTTVEYLVDGEAGSEYIRRIVANEGGAYRPPDRIAPIVEDLSVLSDSQVNDLRTSVRALAAARRAKNEAEGTG